MKPPTIPVITAISMAIGKGTPKLSAKTAMTTIAKDVIVPTERSMPPENLTSVTAMARRASADPCRPIVRRFDVLRNDG